WLGVLALEQRLHGESHWRVTDARLALEKVKRLEALSTEQWQQLAKAWELHAQADSLVQQLRFEQALQPALEAVELRKVTLGEDDRDYVHSLHLLSLVLYYMPNRDPNADSQCREEVKRLCDRCEKDHPEHAVRLCVLGNSSLERNARTAQSEV